jgi:hypothetical protein
MSLLKLTARRGKNFHSPDGIKPKAERELIAQAATAIDMERFPILARNWPGPILIGGQLACCEDSPLATRFDTVPMRGLGR